MARKKKIEETPESLRIRAKLLMKQAEDMEKEAFEKVGRAFAEHIKEDFKNFDLGEFTTTSRAMLSYGSKR